MVKFLKCADCKRKFREERRRPCSEQLLVLLRQKYSESIASSDDFVHETCQAKLYKFFGTNNDPQHQVSAEHTELNYQRP